MILSHVYGCDFCARPESQVGRLYAFKGCNPVALNTPRICGICATEAYAGFSKTPTPERPVKQLTTEAVIQKMRSECREMDKTRTVRAAFSLTLNDIAVLRAYYGEDYALEPCLPRASTGPAPAPNEAAA